MDTRVYGKVEEGMDGHMDKWRKEGRNGWMYGWKVAVGNDWGNE
jgi:hypothetical protein